MRQKTTHSTKRKGREVRRKKAKLCRGEQKSTQSCAFKGQSRSFEARLLMCTDLILLSMFACVHA